MMDPERMIAWAHAVEAAQKIEREYLGTPRAARDLARMEVRKVLDARAR